MRATFIVLLVILPILSPAGASAQSRDEDWTRCSDSKADLSIAGCTAFIESGQETPQALARAFYNRGNAYLSKGANDRAIQDYNQAIRLNPEYARAMNNRGNAYKRKGDVNRAMQDYDQAIGLNPNFVEALNNRGSEYAAKGDYNRAVGDYDQAIKLDPSYALAFNNRGNLYAAKGDHDRAIGDYDQAIQSTGALPEPSTTAVLAISK